MALAIGGAIAAGGSIIGGSMSAGAASSAASAQEAAANEATQTQWNMFQTQQQNEAPYLAAGDQALQNLSAGTQPGGAYNTPFTMAQFSQNPGYQFQQQQGQQAITAGAAARGMNLSPATLQGLSSFNQGLANTDYNNVYNQYISQEELSLGEQQSLAGEGQTAVAGANAAGTNAANNVSSNTIGAGNAAAAGIVGSANAWNGALSSSGQTALNMFQQQQLFGSGGIGSSSVPAGSIDVSGAAANQNIDMSQFDFS